MVLPGPWRTAVVPGTGSVAPPYDCGCRVHAAGTLIYWAAPAAGFRKPDSDHTGTIRTTVLVRRASRNAVEPQIQCVLTQWNPGSSAS